MIGIFGAARIKLVDLAALAHRMSTQLAAGVDLRKIWDHEVDAALGTTRQRYIARGFCSALISLRGENLAEAFKEADDFFPPLFCELVDVGEQSGHLAEVLAQMTTNYNHQIALRRKFRSQMTYPIIQLTLALLVVGGEA